MISRFFKSYFLIILTFLSFFSYITLSEGIPDSSGFSSIESPDTIFYNGNIITMEDSNSLVEAIAIKDDILIIGDDSEILALGDANTSVIDLQGKTIVPGFIDAHSHWIGDRGLTNTTEFNEVMEILVSSGWTSISELFVNQYRLDELQASDEANLLKVRVNAYLALSYDIQRFFCS